jgi:nucleoid DNA-binding protein
VGRSRIAFDALFAKIKEALAKGEPVSIEIA